jgi:hypothetical protein
MVDKSENEGMDGSNNKFASPARDGEENSRDKDEKEDGSIKRNEKAHYILFTQNNILGERVNN